MLNMSQVNRIRDLRKEGYSVAAIAQEVSVDEKTVRKYLKMQDFSPKIPESQTRPSKLDPYKATIDSWLADDERQWYKQRHTAKRVHDRLAEMHPGFDCSYPTVERYVRKARAKRREGRACQELVWHPGESQGDFGEVDCIERGELERKRFLSFVFPYSNVDLSQLFNGETSECLGQGFVDIFTFIGGCPTVLVLDNGPAGGRRMGEMVIEAEVFKRLRAHYGFSVRFTSPDSGWEKGCVENKIGTVRRNRFVPVPEFDDIVEYNRSLLRQSFDSLDDIHYKKRLALGDLFQHDRLALLPLPSYPFDACRYEYCKADGYGKVRPEGNHHYSTKPEFGGMQVLVGIRAHTIDIYDERREILVSHRRRFGKERTDTIDPRTSLAVLMRNVGAWPNSGVRELAPPIVRERFDTMSREMLRDALHTMKVLSDRYGFEHALHSFETVLHDPGVSPLSDAVVFAARMAELDDGGVQGVDLGVYDRFLDQGVGV